MATTTAGELRKNLFNTIDSVIKFNEPVQATAKNGNAASLVKRIRRFSGNGLSYVSTSASFQNQGRRKGKDIRNVQVRFRRGMVNVVALRTIRRLG